MGGMAIVCSVISGSLLIFAALAGWTGYRAQSGKVYGKESPQTVMIAGYLGAALLFVLAIIMPFIFFAL